MLVVIGVLALIISVYLSLGAQSLGHQARTLVRAYLKPGHAAWVLKFCACSASPSPTSSRASAARR